LEKICQGNEGQGNGEKTMSCLYSPDSAFSSKQELNKNRQGNARQWNDLRLCLFSIPLPNIPLPVLPFLVAVCRSVDSASLRESKVIRLWMRLAALRLCVEFLL
jgi:hypothetical protein